MDHLPNSDNLVNVHVSLKCCMCCLFILWQVSSRRVFSSISLVNLFANPIHMKRSQLYVEIAIVS